MDTAQGARPPVLGLDPRSTEFADHFGSYLAARGVLDELAVKRAQRAQRQSGERFTIVLMRLGLLADRLMAQVLASYYDLPLVLERDFPDQPVVSDEIDPAFLNLNRILPLGQRSDGFTVAVADPFNTDAIAA